MKEIKKADIIGVQMDLGASLRGVNMGPLAIRYAGLVDGLSNLDIDIRDKGDLIPLVSNEIGDATMRYSYEINESNKWLYETTKQSLQEGRLPIILGGDHCISAGSIPAVAEAYGEIGVIWIDAHGDFNNGENSPSGNMHGMPLSAITGCGPDSMVAFAKKPCSVSPKNVAIVGARALDKNERKSLRESGVSVFSIHDIDKMGMAEVMRRAIEVAGKDTNGIHISFDMDAVTPESAPGVGTAVHSGLTVREAFLVAEMVADSGKMLSIDMVEVNPMLDICNKTGILACELVLAFFGKSVY